jgi:FkbM family methyltransferase
VFIEREYDPVQVSSPRLILDLGANIGVSAAYFLSRFPTATVIAVEPDANNFEQCKRNLQPYGDRAVLLQGAVWSHKCYLKIHSYPAGGGKEWAVTVTESPLPEAATIEAFDVPAVCALVDFPGPIDLLKVDIEGSEKAVFAEPGAWLWRVRNICIELHGPDCDEVFLKALKPWRCEVSRSGELTICTGLTAI